MIYYQEHSYQHIPEYPPLFTIPFHCQCSLVIYASAESKSICNQSSKLGTRTKYRSKHNNYICEYSTVVLSYGNIALEPDIWTTS